MRKEMGFVFEIKNQAFARSSRCFMPANIVYVESIMIFYFILYFILLFQLPSFT